MSKWAWVVLTVGVMGCRSDKPDPLRARGTVEIPEIDLAPPVAARVVTMRVEEGAIVEPGDTVALLTQSDLPASLAAQRARVATAESRLRDLEVGARPEEIQRGEAELAAAVAEADRTAKDLERMKALAAREVVARQQADHAAAAAAVAAERARSAKEALDLLKAGTRPNQIQAARAEVANARAALGIVEARAVDLVLLAPVKARVLTRQAEPGEQLGPGTPAVTLGDVSRPYVRVFVPAARLSEVKVGDTATVRPDGIPSGADVGVVARVVAISPQAEFTPRVALTEQERADLMFGVKLELLGEGTALHPGLWVSVTFTPRGTPAASSR